MRFSSFVVVSAALAVACGSSSSTNGTPSSPDAGDDGGASSGMPDSGVDSGADAGGDAGDGGSSKDFVGMVSVIDATLPQQHQQSLNAFFLAPIATYAYAPGTCPPGVAGAVQNGSCCYTPSAQFQLTSYLTSGATVPTGGVPKGAGTLTLTDNGTSRGSMAFGGAGNVYLLSLTDPSYDVGDMLGVSATGDAAGVGAFAASAVVPPRFAGVAPTIPQPFGMDLPRSTDFTVSWTAGGNDLVIGTLTDGVATILCTATDSAGTLTFPSALLMMFTAGHESSVELTRNRAGTFPTSAANATVSITASTAFVLGNVKYQ